MTNGGIITGGAFALVIGLVFIFFGLRIARSISLSLKKDAELRQKLMYLNPAISPPTSPSPTLTSDNSGQIILFFILGLIVIILGVFLISYGLTTSPQETMYPFNYGTAFPAHSEPGVLTEEVIGNLL